jgi:Ala-tRNA(Pro) deacylase
MSLPKRVKEYLNQREVNYHELHHSPTHSSVGNALAAHLPMNKVAKAVLLEDHEGHCLMAVLPADCKINIGQLNDTFCANFHLMKESQVTRLFSDCKSGAIPPLGDAYHVKTLIDEELFEQEKIYFEAGDHETLIELDHTDVKKLFSDDPHAHFSHKWSY